MKIPTRWSGFFFIYTEIYNSLLKIFEEKSTMCHAIFSEIFSATKLTFSRFNV